MMTAASQVGLAGLLSGLGQGTGTSNQIMAFLKSTTLAERVIGKMNLMPVLFPKVKDPKDMPPLEEGVKALMLRVIFVDDKKAQLVTVKSFFRDPETAADVANFYVRELESFLKENTFTTAKKNRIFIEGQLERNRAEILEAGKQIASFYSTNQVSNVNPTVDVDVSQVEKPASPETSQIPQDPAEDLQRRADKLKSRLVPGVPQQVYLQYLLLRRELLNQVNGLLTQQYESAKIQEAKEDISFQVVDWGRVPVNRYSPKRVRIVLVTLVLSSILAVFYALGREYLEKAGVRAGRSE
jgi:uncharacterized protein involved in exopolysaccharide biosynthesis